VANDKAEAAIKQQTKSKRVQTVMTPHLFEIISEDKTAGTKTLKEVKIPALSKTGATKSEKIQNGVIEATDSGDDTYNGKDYAILWSNLDEFKVIEEKKHVAQKRD
jgi:hypothetical protein